MRENTEAEQALLEAEAADLSLQRLERRHDQAEERGDAENSGAGRIVVSSLVETYKQKIDDLLGTASAGKSGRRTTIAKYILGCSLNTEEIAFLALRAFTNQILLHRSSHVTDAVVAQSIASRLVDEMFLREVQEEHPKLLRIWQHECDQRSLSRDEARKFMRRQARNMEMTWRFVDPDGVEWDETVQLKVGRALLELLVTSTGAAYLKTIQVSKKQRQKIVFITPQFEEYLQEAKDHLLDKTPFFLPMVVPPRDWSTEEGLYGGGYLTEKTKSYPLVKRAKPDWLDEISENGPDVLLNAINSVQRTPWRINAKVLEALDVVYSMDTGLAGLPNSSRLELPPAPEEYDPDYRRQCWQIHETNRRQLTQRLFVTQVLWLGKKFSEYEEIYFPHDLDSRGRAYPKPAFLNPQGPDFVRGMLEFANGKPLGTERAAAWLAVHVANNWGEDKAKLDDRIAWTMDHEEMISSVAENPLDDLRWTQADEPFQFLQAAIAWKGYLDEGLDYVCRVPIAVDATCSGLQHYSAMLRDEVGGRAVNLLDLEERQDVYQDVADEATKLIEEDLGGDKDSLAKAWLEFGMDRKVTKRSVMVVPYAATYMSCAEYTREAVQDRLTKGESMPWAGEEKDFIHYGAKKIWDAIAKTVVAASEAMRWISKASREYAKEGNTCLTWATPSGMVVKHRKPDMSPWRMDTVLDGSRIRMQAFREKPGLDPKKMSTSTPPSFVHSLDAAHMCLSIDAATFTEIHDFGVVHDSFSTHAADMDDFNQCIRDTFHEMYSQDVLQQFRECFEEGLQEPLEDLPEPGGLDLDQVVHSTFFFS